jgi:WhiB family transcriptional regulator, redox-sensing transcriptional regulator
VSWVYSDVVELCIEPVPEWHKQAACRDLPDPDLYFPERGGTSKPAKALCQTCPVRQECLEHALEAPEQFGIWGGLAEPERRSLRKQQERMTA